MEEKKIYNINVYTWQKWYHVEAFLIAKNSYLRLQRQRAYLNERTLPYIIDIILEDMEPNNLPLDVVMLLRVNEQELVQKFRDALSHKPNIVIHFIG